MNRERTIPNFVNIRPKESENLQNIFKKHDFNNIKTNYPQALITKFLDGHEKRFFLFQ